MLRGSITLRRESEPEVRELTEAQMWVNWMPAEVAERELDCEIVLSFKAPDRPISGAMSPAGFTPVDGEVRIKVESFSEAKLVGSTFSIPCGYDQTSDEYLTRLYHFDHLELDQVQIHFLDLLEGRFHIRIVGTCELDTYGRSGPLSEVVVDGWFDWSVEEQSENHSVDAPNTSFERTREG
jgi:hypothetical protein